MKGKLIIGLLLLLYSVFLPPFTQFMKQRPVEVKLGYVPHPRVLKLMSADQNLLTAASMITKVLFYYGTLVQKYNENIIIYPEQENMFKTLLTAVQLDPYNMDAYYFAQASFTWGVGRVKEVNKLLERGALFRKWDPSLPFYIGFNNAYFLKKYTLAAEYMKKAAEISGNPMYTNLAARYFYESAQTAFGLAFLEAMIKSAHDDTVRQSYKIRYDSLLAVHQIETAIVHYRKKHGSDPKRIEDMIEDGFLEKSPADPYGGTFYLDEQGKVRTTSKLAPMKRE